MQGESLNEHGAFMFVLIQVEHTQVFIGRFDVKKVSIKLPDVLVRGLDRLVEISMYPNRAEAIRFAVRDLLFIEVGIKVLTENDCG